MAPASFGTIVIYEQKTLLSVDEKARGQHCKKDDHVPLPQPPLVEMDEYKKIFN
jgi:hypothetical protein